ncbi:MAG: DUF4340 domain-containing protein [Gammaproteobacteria bacterium]|nr:DUF4340 domain-containing protein [Gammaproteobacteria bacterium]
MERHHTALAALLALQLLVIAGIWMFADGGSASEPHRLVAFERDAVSAIDIDDRTTTVRIERTSDGWALPGEEVLPVDDAKVATLLDKLEQAEAPWPVATSESSAERFEVTAENYQRRVRLFDGDDQAAEVFFGTSPGFRKVHARLADTSDVYAVAFANFEASIAAEDWLDKTLLQPKGAISAITRKTGYTITQADAAWTLTDASTTETLNQDTARDLASKLANLRVLGRAEAAPAADAVALMTFDIVAEGGPLQLSFYRAAEEGDFLLGSDRFGAYFRVSEYIGEGLNLDRQALLVSPPTTETPAPAVNEAS